MKTYVKTKEFGPVGGGDARLKLLYVDPPLHLVKLIVSAVVLGLVSPLVAQKLMGKTGEILMLLLLLMAVTSTGSAEVIAVTSILVYDIYQLYLKVSRARNRCYLSSVPHDHICYW